MADNTLLNVGTGGDTVASDDIGAVKYQRVKLVEGADGVNDGDISASNPLPVESRGIFNRTASGALGALNAAVTINAEGTGASNWEIDTGTLVGTVVFEATLNDVDWFSIDAIRIGGAIIASTTTFADRGALTSSGYSQARLRVSTFTSGTSNARLEASEGTSVVRLGQALPTGTSNIGKIDARVRNAADSAYIEPSTDRITAAGPFSARLSDGTAFYDATKTGQLPVALVGGRLDVTIGASPVTVSVDSELPAAAALSDVLGNLTVPNVGAGVLAFNGTNYLRIRAATAAPAGTEQALIVRNIPSGTQAVSGTVTANAGTGTFTADVTDRAARLVGQVEGRAASGVAKAGNPNQIGGVFNTTQPTVVTGQVVEAQYTARGATIIASGVDAVNVADGAGSLTIDAPVGTPVAVRISDGAAFISPATDRTAAAGPFSIRLSDGAAFYDATKTGQLPTALVGGRLDVTLGAAPATVTVDAVNAGTSTAPAQTAVGTIAVQLLAANTARRQAMIQNTGTTVIKLTLSATDPTQTVYHVALRAAGAADDGAGGTFITDLWTGRIAAISSAAGGTVVVTELTA